MALIRCPHCGKSVSNMAHVCPHCGNQITAAPPVNSSSNNLNKPLLAALAAAVEILLGLGFYIIYSSNNTHKYDRPITTTQESGNAAQQQASNNNQQGTAPAAALDGLTEYTIESQKWGYAWVRSGTDKNSETNKVKKILTGERFYGKRMESNPDWMEVYDNNGNWIGYMYYKCARLPKN